MMWGWGWGCIPPTPVVYIVSASLIYTEKIKSISVAFLFHLLYPLYTVI